MIDTKLNDKNILTNWMKELPFFEKGAFYLRSLESQKMNNKKIAVLTSVRNDVMFTDRWIKYYSSCFGAENLYIQLDGMDQPIPDKDTGVNVIRHEFVKRNVVVGEKFRAKRASELAKKLFTEMGYDIVIGTDIDEFLVVDPDLNTPLSDYLSGLSIKGSISGLGLDVIQKEDTETGIESDRPFLAQRRFAVLSHRYTKPAVLSEPLQWGSGYHRVKGRNFRIDPNLFMFHFGSVDRSVSAERLNDRDRIDQGWTAHQVKRDKAFSDVLMMDPVDGDERFASARFEMKWRRPLYALNKPGQLRKRSLVTIPKRFENVV